MNQILITNLKKQHKLIFKIQLFISIIAIIAIVIYLYRDYYQSENLEYLSKIINKNMQIASLYQVKKQSKEESAYMGKITIPKINLEYVIFKEFNEELLKIAPCKFYGVGIGEQGNICIAGHNYNDNRFFGRLNELQVKDEIILTDLNQKEYQYTVFDIFETDEHDTESVLRKQNKYELSLVTCNNTNKKRIIVKAFANIK